jgi:hypothetical protein
MDCREVQDWLLAAEDVRPEACCRGPVADHLRDCADCRALAERLAGLEHAWRAIPLSDGCHRAKQAFLDRLAPTPAAKPISRRSLLQRVAAASAATALAGAGAWLLLGSRQAEASDDLVDSLLDWNLRLTHADSADLRRQLYAQDGPRLESAVATGHLPAEQSLLAVAMLDNGRWLVDHRDPLDEADRFDDLADHLLRMAHAAEKKGNYQRMNRLLGQYGRAISSGIDLNLDRADTSTARDARHRQKLQRLLSRYDQRTEELAAFGQAAPEPTRKEIQRALKLHQKHRKKEGKT